MQGHILICWSYHWVSSDNLMVMIRKQKPTCYCRWSIKLGLLLITLIEVQTPNPSSPSYPYYPKKKNTLGPEEVAAESECVR